MQATQVAFAPCCRGFSLQQGDFSNSLLEALSESLKWLKKPRAVIAGISSRYVSVASLQIGCRRGRARTNTNFHRVTFVWALVKPARRFRECCARIRGYRRLQRRNAVTARDPSLCKRANHRVSTDEVGLARTASTRCANLNWARAPCPDFHKTLPRARCPQRE